MSSPTLELQDAVRDRLLGIPALMALINGVWDQPPTARFAGPKQGYVSFGPKQSLADDADCITGFEITMQIDAWSRHIGVPAVERIAEEVRAALHGYDLPLTDNALVSFEHRQTRVFRDPDGLTNHAALEFIALVEQP